MNEIKSLFLWIVLSALVVLVVLFLRQCILLHKETRRLSKKALAKLIGTLAATTVFCVFLGDYLNPYERVLTPVLVAEITVPEEKQCDYPGEKFWHGAYEQYGLYAESFYFNPQKKQSVFYSFEQIDMDFEHHSYVITYGQKIQSLSYNVWETIDVPVRTGAKVGHMILEDAFEADKIYVYQIPKLRIENDVNHTRH